MKNASKPWVDGPYKLISPEVTGDRADKRATGASRVAAEMSLVHNTLIRGINAVYLQCVNVGERGSAKDKMDFAWFARQWSSFLNHHHSLEEDTLFPEINRLSGVADFMDASLEEHEVFHTGVHGFDEYLAKVTAGEEPYDGKKLKSIIDSFMPALETHLANEIKTLLRLAEYEDKVNWPEWFDKRVGEQAKKLLDSPDYKTNIIPLALILHDKQFGDGVWAHFPPVPWFVHLMLRWLYVPTHKDWWRFAGCDARSNPKELPFA